MVENEGVIFVREAQIVGGGERLLAEIVKIKSRHTHEGARHVDAAAVQRQILRRALMTAGKPRPGRVERLVG